MLKNNNKKGFTLMEMLIVVTIIGILAAIVLPRFVTSSGAAKNSAHKAARQSINSQIELYYFVYDEYPTVMSDAGWNAGEDGRAARYFPEGVPTACNRYSAWAIDSTSHRLTTHTDHE